MGHPRLSGLFLWALLGLGACRQEGRDVSRSIIDGAWQTACVTASDQSSERVTYDFKASNAVTRRGEYFSDAACQVPRGAIVHEGIFELAVHTGDLLYDINIFFRKATGVPADEAGASAWNQQGFCGLTRWLADVGEEVISQVDARCGVFGVSQIEYFDVISVDAEKTLTFGADLRDRAVRPTTVDAQNPLKVFLFQSP